LPRYMQWCNLLQWISSVSSCHWVICLDLFSSENIGLQSHDHEKL
jgi:hypothetical protein